MIPCYKETDSLHKETLCPIVMSIYMPHKLQLTCLNMKNGLVSEDNALMNASYNLEVTEQRLILLAIINARETQQGITSDSKLEIHASDYANQFNVKKETAYEALKSAVNNLFERQFSFKETTKKGVGIV